MQLLNQNNAELYHLKEQYHSLQKNHENQMRQLQEISNELSVFKERCEQHQRQLQIYNNDIKNKNQQLMEFVKQIAIVTDQRDRLQKNLSDAEDKIEMLRQEKLFVIQEKSQLEGHLKHLEKISIAR